MMLYRSRGDVSIPDIGRRCPRITTMSLTKCGAMKMAEVEGRDVDRHWEMLVEINLQVYPTCVYTSKTCGNNQELFLHANCR